MTGCKGGTGKTLLSISLLAYLRAIGKEVLPVGCNDDADSLVKIYDGYFWDFRDDESFGELVNLLESEANANKHVVIDAESRNLKHEFTYGGILNQFVRHNKVKMNLLCVAGNWRIGTEYLGVYKKIFSNAYPVLVYNEFFGEPKRMSRRDIYESFGAEYIRFPVMVDPDFSKVFLEHIMERKRDSQYLDMLFREKFGEIESVRWADELSTRFACTLSLV